MLNILIPVIAAVLAAAMIIVWALYCMQGKNRRGNQSPLFGILGVVFGFFIIALAIVSKAGIIENLTSPENPEPTAAVDQLPQGTQDPTDPNAAMPANTGEVPLGQESQESTPPIAPASGNPGGEDEFRGGRGEASQGGDAAASGENPGGSNPGTDQENYETNE